MIIDVAQSPGELIHVRPTWYGWRSTCTCGQYDRRYLRWGNARQWAELHAALHNWRPPS